MEARAKLLGHPIHQMLIVLPLGLLSGAFAFDLVYWLLGGPEWALVSYWMIVAGILGGLLAAPFGLLDWTKIPSGTRAKRIGALHATANVLVLLLYGVSAWLRTLNGTEPTLLASLLVGAGFLLSGLSGWLGGELVDRLGVGVDDGAHLNAPSSLTHSSARESPGS